MFPFNEQVKAVGTNSPLSMLLSATSNAKWHNMDNTMLFKAIQSPSPKLVLCYKKTTIDSFHTILLDVLASTGFKDCFLFAI